MILLCSDGLSNVVDGTSLAELLTCHPDPEECCRALLARAVEQGAPDNVTAVVAQLS